MQLCRHLPLPGSASQPLNCPVLPLFLPPNLLLSRSEGLKGGKGAWGVSQEEIQAASPPELGKLRGWLDCMASSGPRMGCCLQIQAPYLFLSQCYL